MMLNRLRRLTILLLVTGLSQSSYSEESPEMRPALLGNGPKSLVNIIDTQALSKKVQGNAAVMFSCLIEADGHPLLAHTYRWTPGAEALEREVSRKLLEAKFIPAIYNHQRRAADLYGTIIYRVVDGKPRLRIFLNQEMSELE
jgi:hypothetical protein